MTADLAHRHRLEPPTTLTDRTPTMTDNRHTEIELNGHTGKVVIGGHDLSHAVQGLTLRAGVDEVPSLELELCIPTMDVAGEMDVEVFMPEQTRKALIALGWTPPAEAEAGDAA